MTSPQENERPTPAPQVGRAIPRPRSATGQAGRLSLRAAVPCCAGVLRRVWLSFGQVKETGAASLYLMKQGLLMEQGSGWLRDIFVPEVPVKTRASTFAVLALSFLKWEVFYARTDQNTKSEMKTAVLGDRTITIKKSYSHSAPREREKRRREVEQQLLTCSVNMPDSGGSQRHPC